MNQREEFNKWYESQHYHEYDRKSSWITWQAAISSQQPRIAELEAANLVLIADREHMTIERNISESLCADLQERVELAIAELAHAQAERGEANEQIDAMRASYKDAKSHFDSLKSDYDAMVLSVVRAGRY